MADQNDAARLFVRAQSGDSLAANAIADSLAEDVAYTLPRSELKGRVAVVDHLLNAEAAKAFAPATWDEPAQREGAVAIAGRLPITAQLGGFEFVFSFDGEGRIAAVQQSNLPAPPMPPSPLGMTDEMKDAVDGAFGNNSPILVATVDGTGTARLTFRGTVQTLGDDKLAFWARNGSGETVTSLDTNPRVTVLYRDPRSRTTYYFYGNGQVTGDEAERRHVYDNSPAPERASDPQVKGVAVVIELDRIEGFGPRDGRVNQIKGA